MSQSLPPELPSKEDTVRLQLKLSTTLIPGATLQWLKSHGQQDQVLEAAAAYWSPFAIRDQNPDPMWSQAQALLSIARLQQHILLIQRSFGMAPTNNGAPHPLSSPMSEGFVSQVSPSPAKSAIPVAAPPEPNTSRAGNPIAVVSPAAVDSPPPDQDDSDGYNIHIGGFEDFDAALEDDSVE